MVDFGVPVTVGGLEVSSGDLLVGDQHGIVQVPLDIAREVPKAVRIVEDWERRVIEASRSEDWTFGAMKEAYLSTRPTWPAG
jgi:regulator of RNase E activity RraA